MLYRFGSYELDLARGELRAQDAVVPVEPQVFALLALLVENRDRLVTRDEILDSIWDGRVVSDSALASRVKSARRVLGDDGRSQRFIRTLHGRGLRFVADVKVEHAAPMPGQPAPGPVVDTSVETAARPSLAVLRFRLVGAASGPGATIAEALPHELITELARLRWLFITARGSSFRVSADDTDLREIGRLLGVRYCLTGSVEVTGPRLAITVELADTREGRIVWAERYGGRIDDVHAIREEIRSKILTALELQIPLHEASLARLTVAANLDAWSAYHLGLQHMYRFNRADNAAATALFQQAVAREPGFARAHAGLSFVHFQTAFMRHTDDIAGESALARRFAERGMELDPLDPFVNFTMGRTHWLTGDLDGGLAWLERATALSPNYAQGLYARGWTEALSGRGIEGRGHVDLSMRLSPLDPLYYAMLGTRAFTHLVVGEDLVAAEWAEKAARAPGAHVLIAMIACATQSLVGSDLKAAEWAANVRSRNPVLTRADFFRSFPIKSDVTRARLAAALERCGF